MTAPVVGVSILLLAVGVIAAWYVQRMQRNASDVLALNVGSMRAAEELEIGLREIRTQMNQYLLTGNRASMDAIPALRVETDRWLREAERFATTPHEQQLMASMKRGYDHFFDEFDRLAHGQPGERPRDEVASLVNDVLCRIKGDCPPSAFCGPHRLAAAGVRTMSVPSVARTVLPLLESEP